MWHHGLARTILGVYMILMCLLPLSHDCHMTNSCHMSGHMTNSCHMSGHMTNSCHMSVIWPTQLSHDCHMINTAVTWLTQLSHDCRYETVRRNISEKYAEMEKQLVDAFIEAQSSLDTRRMKQYARALQPFSYVCDNYWPSSILCRACFHETHYHVGSCIKRVYRTPPPCRMTPL